MTTDRGPTPTQRWIEAWQTWMEGWTAVAAPDRAREAPGDPFTVWRRAFDQWLEGWSLYFDQTLSTPEVAAAGGWLLDARLNLEKPLREQTAQLMADWLEFFNVASYQQQVRAARQLNEANLRLDELREQLEALTDQVAGVVATSSIAARPVRAMASARGAS